MPFFNFNQFTGRLKENNRINPLFPVKPVPLETTEIPVIKFDSMKTQAAKSAAPTGTGRNPADYGRLHPRNHAFMKKIQADLESPIFLAKGTPDKILFGITVLVVVGGVLESLRFLYNRANHK